MLDVQNSGTFEAEALSGKPRDFVDVMWQIAEKRSCDEVVVRYDCGHSFKAEVTVPVLPKIREYTNEEADRRRFMQHSIFVLTKNPGSPKVQIAVPEGRCRHCSRGQRQALVCGPLHMDLSEERQATARRQGDPLADSTARAKANGVPRGGDSRNQGRDMAAAALQSALAGMARRLEFSFSSHVFLAAMGQVCRLPDNITPPPLLQNSSVLQSGALKPIDGPAAKEGLHQWSRKEIEDELKAEVVKYVGGATFLFMFVAIECLYLCFVQFGPSAHGAGAVGGNSSRSSGELRDLSSVSSIEMGVANSTWVLSTLTHTVHRAFGPARDLNGDSSASFCWTFIVHPIWIFLSVVLAPFLWVVDLAIALPRFLLLHVMLALARSLVWRPCSWLFSVAVELANNSMVFVFQCLLSRPTAMLSQMQTPMTNPMVVAMVLSLLVAALSAPQPPSLPLPGVWGDLPSLEITKALRRVMACSRLGPFVQRLRTMWAFARKEGRPKGGLRGVAAARGQKDKANADRTGREGREGLGGRPDRPQAGRQDGRTQSLQPACFLCLDRPSRYILEPCGHRVVCGECAVQLVEAAARNRSMNEAAGVHHVSDKSGGACPSCGLAITRAMRVLS